MKMKICGKEIVYDDDIKKWHHIGKYGTYTYCLSKATPKVEMVEGENKVQIIIKVMKHDKIN